MKRLLLVLTISLTCLVSVPGGVSAVTYGDPVESPQVEFPEVVPIWVGGKTLCTGTLIQQQVVLTAAHCIYGEPGPFQISVGAKTLNSGALIDVDATWYHPRYDASFSQNDIALLHLKTSANVSRLGVLPLAKLKTLGKKFLIVGWGRDQNGLVTGKLNRLTLNDQTIAAKRDFKGFYNPKTMVGAGRYFADEVLYGGGCTGDSGGPLYQGAAGSSRTIIGLTSFGARGSVDYKPTIFTRVDFYVPEIIKGIDLLNSRSVSAPIATGKATPSGVGPTTTTTTAPLKPLTLNCTLSSTVRSGFSAGCSANLWTGYQSWNGFGPKNFTHLVKVCISIDGSAPSLYTESNYGYGVMFEYVNNSAYTAGQGCWSFSNSNSFNITSIGGYGAGSHSATITITDSVGRTISSSFAYSSTY